MDQLGIHAGKSTLNPTPYERRDELAAERAALLNSLEGIKSLFVATFADELPQRWEFVTQAWFNARNEPPPGNAHATPQSEEFQIEARRIAHSFLDGEGVWAHQKPGNAIRAVGAYAPTGNGSRWTHVSSAMGAAEYEPIRRLEQEDTALPEEIGEYELGSVSEPLTHILYAYSEAFTRLQKVHIATARVAQQLPRPRPNLTRASRP